MLLLSVFLRFAHEQRQASFQCLILSSLYHQKLFPSFHHQKYYRVNISHSASLGHYASLSFVVRGKGTKNRLRLQAPSQPRARNQLLLFGSCTTSTRSPSRGLRKLTRSPWTGTAAGSSNMRSPGEKGTGFRTSSTANAMWWRTDLPPRNLT